MSDNDPAFQVGRRLASPNSSRESSPVAKRQRRSFSPPSDDDDLVVPVAHTEHAETPTPENAPLIRQAVGFSWSPSLSTVCTYQATTSQQPAVAHFLPGQTPQAPPPPPDPKPSKQRAPRKKKDQQFSSQTTKFKLTTSGSTTSPASGYASLAATSPGNSAGTSSSSGVPCSTTLSSLMTPSHTFGRPTSADPASKRAKKSTKRKASAPSNDSYTVRQSASIGTPTERPGHAPNLQRTFSALPHAGSGGATSGKSCPFRPDADSLLSATLQSTTRPLRVVTLLIEDLRSGVPDPQLAEVRVPLKIAQDPEDGFWADAAEICEALQSGPSRVDGPAKVYTMRGRFRQFFMRLDQFDQLQIQSAYIGVSKERTLSVFVEAPLPQGQLPRPPVPSSDVQPADNSSERETVSHSETSCRPTYSLVTREDQMERLSKSSYVRPQGTRFSPVSESGSYGHSRRTSSPQRPSRHEQDYGRPLTPAIAGQFADTQEEIDEAIANYIRSHIENHPGWIEYMQSKAKPQRVSEVLKQYAFVEDRIRELCGRRTPKHWDGAPSSCVEKRHIWRVLKLDPKWGEECQDASILVAYYGKKGARYEDARVVDMINDVLPPKPNAIDRFLRLLKSVDESFMQSAFRGQLAPTS